MDPELERHYGSVVRALQRGRLIPFLGAGANLCGRPQELNWSADERLFLPSGSELSSHLARKFQAPLDEVHDLVRVSQCVSLLEGSGVLYSELHDVFDRDYPPTDVHQLLAQLPGYLRTIGAESPHMLMVTTNYDDLLERALDAAGEPYDLVTYLAEGPDRGKFRHVRQNGETSTVEEPNNYGELSLASGSVILKLHGAVSRARELTEDSYVITEDHYIDYLTRTDLSNLVPVKLAAMLRHSHLLFLGYALRDWNLRVILHRIAGDEQLHFKSWAVQVDASRLDREFWARREVTVLPLSLEYYITGLKNTIAPSDASR